MFHLVLTAHFSATPRSFFLLSVDISCSAIPLHSAVHLQIPIVEFDFTATIPMHCTLSHTMPFLRCIPLNFCSLLQLTIFVIFVIFVNAMQCNAPPFVSLPFHPLHCMALHALPFPSLPFPSLPFPCKALLNNRPASSCHVMTWQRPRSPG